MVLTSSGLNLIVDGSDVMGHKGCLIWLVGTLNRIGLMIRTLLLFYPIVCLCLIRLMFIQIAVLLSYLIQPLVVFLVTHFEYWFLN